MKRRIFIALLCVSMIASTLTACGGSSKESSSKESSSKIETIKENTKDNTDSEEPKEEDTEKKENQSEIVEKKYNRENFWDEFKIIADGNEIILGETSLQDLKNMGYSFEFTASSNSYTSIFKDGNRQFEVLTFFNGDATDVNDLSANIIEEIAIRSRHNVPDCISIGDFTSNTTPEDVYETLGIPDYFSNEEELEYDDGYEWIYYNDDKNVLLWFVFEYTDSGDRDFVMYISNGEEAKVLYEERVKKFDRFTSGNNIFKELYPSFAGNENVEQETPVTSDDKTVTIEGKQITLKETTVDELIAMFPEMEYIPYYLSSYKDNDEQCTYAFDFMNENIYMRVYSKDYEAEERANKRDCHSTNTIELEGNEPEIDLSKFKVFRIDFQSRILLQRIYDDTIADNDKLNEEIKNSLILYNGVKIGMTEEEVLKIYPELSCSQESGSFVVYDAEFNKESRMNYRLSFDAAQEGTERRLTSVTMVIW